MTAQTAFSLAIVSPYTFQEPLGIVKAGSPFGLFEKGARLALQCLPGKTRWVAQIMRHSCLCNFKWVCLLTICVFVGLTACRILKGPTPTEFYKETLNFDRLPESMSALEGEGTDRFPVWLSYGYLRYRATPDYWRMLGEHMDFLEPSEFNLPIREIGCMGREMPNDFSYWTRNEIELERKICYQGTFFPYIHYFVYDPTTQRVDHFIEGMRD
jgi:hypothetical protein